jgi:hypothetical protein
MGEIKDTYCMKCCLYLPKHTTSLPLHFLSEGVFLQQSVSSCSSGSAPEPDDISDSSSCLLLCMKCLLSVSILNAQPFSMWAQKNAKVRIKISSPGDVLQQLGATQERVAVKQASHVLKPLPGGVISALLWYLEGTDSNLHEMVSFSQLI